MIFAHDNRQSQSQYYELKLMKLWTVFTALLSYRQFYYTNSK